VVHQKRPAIGATRRLARAWVATRATAAAAAARAPALRVRIDVMMCSIVGPRLGALLEARPGAVVQQQHVELRREPRTRHARNQVRLACSSQARGRRASAPQPQRGARHCRRHEPQRHVLVGEHVGMMGVMMPAAPGAFRSGGALRVRRRRRRGAHDVEVGFWRRVGHNAVRPEGADVYRFGQPGRRRSNARDASACLPVEDVEMLNAKVQAMQSQAMRRLGRHVRRRHQ
jgi:hypothetical protein